MLYVMSSFYLNAHIQDQLQIIQISLGVPAVGFFVVVFGSFLLFDSSGGGRSMWCMY